MVCSRSSLCGGRGQVELAGEIDHEGLALLAFEVEYAVMAVPR